MADTCGTLELAAQKLAEIGARRVVAVITHGILSDPAMERIEQSSMTKLVVTNTLPQTRHLLQCAKLEEIDISAVLAETIRRSHYGDSVSVLFNEVPLPHNQSTQPYYRSQAVIKKEETKWSGSNSKSWFKDQQRARSIASNTGLGLGSGQYMMMQSGTQRETGTSDAKTPVPAKVQAKSTSTPQDPTQGWSRGA